MPPLDSKPQVEISLKCTHCNEPAHPPLYNETGQVFCCHGCQTVYEVLHAKGLQDYYEIKQQTNTYKRRAPVNIHAGKFLYLDDGDFLNEFSYKIDGNRTMEFYLEGIHCLACLWLVERLPLFHPNVLSSKLDLEKSIATVCINDGGKFSAVANEFNQLGYRPHPLKRDQQSHQLKLKEDRQALLRIGVAAAGASNIMLYAVSLYAGAQATYALVFNALTVIFAIPVLTYSAWPFYLNAWNALKNKTLSIDIPISLALLVGLIMGVRNLIVGIHENFFDSLTMLVFLLLLSRYFLKKLQERALNTKDLHYFYQGESAYRARDNSCQHFEEIHPKFIRTDDILKIQPGDFIPVDGIVIKGASALNTSLLSGESAPTKVNLNDAVYAGTQNLSNELLIKTLKTKERTRLGEILKGVESGWASKAAIIEITDRVSQYFIAVVFALSAVLFSYCFYQVDLHHAIEQTLTLLIVTCPCALALATPLAFTQALSKAAEHGMIIKSDAVIERIANLKNLFFDKTGTLTYGKLAITEFQLEQPPNDLLWDAIYSLEMRSRHPVAQALSQYAKERGGRLLDISDYLERPGLGVEGVINDHHYAINHGGVHKDGKLWARFKFSDRVREDSPSSLAQLKSHYHIKLLSGDHKDNVLSLAQQVGLNSQQVYWQLSPEQKSFLVKNSEHSMMVGDGANDAIALSHADVGVAVLGAMDISLRAADVFLVTPGISTILKLTTIAKETMGLIKRNLVLSLMYNAISVVLVFMGLITPLAAAIIMPLSSLTVLISTLIGTKKLRAVWKSS